MLAGITQSVDRERQAADHGNGRSVMAKRQYSKGLHDLGNGVFAYLQPDGSWGWSNAGLIVDGPHSLLVDTLFDLDLTRDMLAAMRRATPAADRIDTVVNTHANGDHCWGNQLVAEAEIVASKAGADEMAELPPQALAEMMATAPTMGEVGEYLSQIFSPFDFAGIDLAPPTRTFAGELELTVGGKGLRLIEVGPAHTRGDVLVHLPDDRIVFTGDILFIGGHPIIWAGPVDNWIDACERIHEMDVEAIVPGHGPITDKAGVTRVRDYLVYVRDEARRRFDAGLSVDEAARDIALGDFAGWSESERILVNVDTLYRGFRGETSSANIPALLVRMAALARERGLYGLKSNS
jgi:glyoxylase-like metal-dependent hydrolase (beta-lactamase superfamily II)